MAVLATAALACKLRKDPGVDAGGAASLLDELSPAEAASARAAFRPAAASLPRCTKPTPFLCEVLGHGKKNDRDRYEDCEKAPEVSASGCRDLEPLDLGCLDAPPPAATCRIDADGLRSNHALEPPVGDAQGPGGLPGRNPNLVGGFDAWNGKRPSVKVYLVLPPGAKQAKVVRNDADLAAVFNPVDTPAKALQLLSLRASSPEWRAVEARGDGWQAWVLGSDSPGGCSQAYLCETSAHISRSGKVTGVREQIVSYGSEYCAD